MKYSKPTVTERILEIISLLTAMCPLVLICALVLWLLQSLGGDQSIHRYGSLPADLSQSIGPSFQTSITLAILALGVAIPIGVGTAVYLVELASPTRFTNVLESALFNLAGVPSILYGLASLVILTGELHIPTGIWMSSTTLAMVALPVITLSSVQALRSIPDGVREAALGLGASPWDAARLVVLPLALPSIITGIILALGRVLGEAAALLVLFGATISTNDYAPALPVRIYDWLALGEANSIGRAGTAVALLLICVAAINGTASAVRSKYRELR